MSSNGVYWDFGAGCLSAHVFQHPDAAGAIFQAQHQLMLTNRKLNLLDLIGKHQDTLLRYALLAAVCMIIAAPMRAQSGSITILVYDYARVPPGTLREAEQHADKIVATAGVSVNWLHCFAANSLSGDAKTLCDSGWTAQTPALRFISGIDRHQPREYGHTDVPVLITVYYDVISHTWHHDYTDAEIPNVLGCVVAHELGHLLLRDTSHSSTGIMQSQWSRDQMRLAIWGALGFTKEQLTRIRSQARLLARTQLSD